jgi:hypothetical protein
MATPLYQAWQVQRRALGGAWINYGAPTVAGDTFHQTAKPITVISDSQASQFAHGVAQHLRDHFDERAKNSWRVRVVRIEHHAEKEY